MALYSRNEIGNKIGFIAFKSETVSAAQTHLDSSAPFTIQLNAGDVMDRQSQCPALPGEIDIPAAKQQESNVLQHQLTNTQGWVLRVWAIEVIRAGLKLMVLGIKNPQ
jgi:hypothetical protein